MTKLKLALLLSTAAFGFASAQTLDLTQSKVVMVKEGDKMVEKLEAAPNILPNDIIQYTVKLNNPRAEKLVGVRLQLPIPTGTTYLGQQKCSLASSKAMYSIEPHTLDAKTKAINNVSTRRYADPAALMKTVIVKQNGTDVKREVNATAADYTAVRWQLPDLTAKQTVECSIRVKVK